VSQALRLAITLSFMAVMLGLSIVPGEAQDSDSFFIWAVAATPTLLQKTLHVLFYAVLTVLWAWTLEVMQSVYLRLAVAVCVAIGFGILMEWAQIYIPGRFGALGDVLLNALGAFLGLGLAVLLGSASLRRA